MDPDSLPTSPEKRQKPKGKKPKTWVDASDGSERPTRIGKKYAVDHSTGEVSYKRVKSAQLRQSIQLGIRTMVASITSKKGRDLLHTDFSEVESRYFPSSGSSNTVPHHNSDFKFYSYAPYAFRLFRQHFGINTAEFMLSLCDKPLIPLSNPGASGSVFYLSYDDTFIIKTVQKSEHTFMMRLLPGYYMNLVQNKKTLLPKFFGLFCYQNSLGKNIRFIVMNNIVPSRLSYFRKFDLKGSTKGRTASEKERRKKSPTYKDLDFMEMHQQEGFILSQSTFDKLKETLHRDVLVLESFRIMDYSLFIGVHRISIDEVKAERIDTDSDYTDGEDDAAGPSTIAVRSNAVIIKINGCTGDLTYINGVYEQIPDGALVHGRPAFKRCIPVPAGNGAMSGSPLFLHFHSELHIWRMSSALDRTNMAILLRSTKGEYNSPLDVPIGCWEVLTPEGVHIKDSKINASVADEAEVAAIKSQKPGEDIVALGGRHNRRRSMSFGTISEQLDLTVAQSLNHSIEKEDKDDLYAGGLRLKLRDDSGKIVDAVAYLGIIDILQNFRLSKRLEHRFKKLMYDGDACSVHNPNFYRRRFQNFMCGTTTNGVFRPASNEEDSETKVATNPPTMRKSMSGIQNPHFSQERRGSGSRTASASSSSSARRAAANARGRSHQRKSNLGQSSPAGSASVSSDSSDDEVDRRKERPSRSNSTSRETSGPSPATPQLENLNVSGISDWSEPMTPGNVLPPIRGILRPEAFSETSSAPPVSDDEANRLKAEIAAARIARKSSQGGSAAVASNPVITNPPSTESPAVIANTSRDDAELDEFRKLEEQTDRDPHLLQSPELSTLRAAPVVNQMPMRARVLTPQKETML